MAAIDLTTLLTLVGTLNDTSEKDSASDRFRDYLKNNLHRWPDVHDYIEESLKISGDQYNKALQDLINHIGHLLGFSVLFGRYRGIRGQVGYDGLWQSPSGWAIVVEAKTTDTYTVRTDTVLGYINSLVSDGRVKSTSKVIGLYVYGRFDNNTNQLENAIAIENRRNQLRVISVPALLGLLELKQEYGLDHESILGLLLPAPIRIDPIVELIRGVVAKEQERDFQSLAIPENLSEPSDPVPTLLEPPSQSTLTAKKRTAVRSNKRISFTGKKVNSIVFLGNRHKVSKWREAFDTVVNELIKLDKSRFLEVAPTIFGKKRPYFSENPSLMRKADIVTGTSLYYETNLNADNLANIAWELVKRMGYDDSDLEFDVD